MAPLQHRLRAARPGKTIADHRHALLRLRDRLAQADSQARKQQAARLAELAHALQALSPLATLDRGFAIARTADGAVLRSAEQTRTGEAITVRLGRGELDATVTGTR